MIYNGLRVALRTSYYRFKISRSFKIIDLLMIRFNLIRLKVHKFLHVETKCWSLRQHQAAEVTSVNFEGQDNLGFIKV